jgi:hypothetical protein
MGVLGDIPLGVKRPGFEADHSSASSEEVKNMWRCTFTLTFAFRVCRGASLPSYEFSTYSHPGI